MAGVVLVDPLPRTLDLIMDEPTRARGGGEGAVNIGLLHTRLNGSPGHDRYALCGPGELQAAGFLDWAFGDLKGATPLFWHFDACAANATCCGRRERARPPPEGLRRLMGEMTQDDAYRTGIAAMAEELRTRIPAECRSLPGTDKDRFAANLAEAEAAGRDGGEGSEIGNLDAADARCGGRRL